MNSKHIRGDYNVAWPTAEIAVMGPKGAVEILYKGEEATDEREAEYRERFAHPYLAAGRGYVDDIIDPRDTRLRLIDALGTLATKRDRNPPKKHGNIPL
jgi:acetyl-CoA carboxylase carboxyltransferase component